MNIRPIKDRILVRQQTAKTMSEGGLHLPQGKETYENVAEVLAVGSKVTEVSPGQVITFQRRPDSHLGELRKEWQDLLVIKEEDVTGVVED